MERILGRVDLMSLNRNRIPQPLWNLIPEAEKWGVSDDKRRGAMLNSADSTELKRILDAVDSVDEDIFDDWMSGSEADSVVPSFEYVAFSCLMMVAESARIRLKRKNGSNSPNAC